LTDRQTRLAKLLAEISQRGAASTLASGSILWREGDPGDSVVYLVEGTLVVTDRTPEGEIVVLRTMEAGSIVGELAAFDGKPRSAMVRASSDCRIVSLPAGDFLKLVGDRPDILAELFFLQVDRIRSLTSRVTHTHHRAITDRLTHLYNYGFFRERLSLELERARAMGDLISLVMFDIDHFKHYNDMHGHEAGNKILRDMAEIFRATARRGDILVRYGGEEFAALLYGATADEAARFAENVRRSVEAYSFEGAESQPLGRITISAGVATLEADVATDETLIHAADRSLYLAKDRGRNRVVVGKDDIQR
jgi:diguanylate cyclase (GGDEF)-like protein